MLSVFPIQAFQDNYIWCIEDSESRECIVVDPGDGKPVVEYITSRRLTLKALLITHHHFDHTGGIAALTEKYGPEVYGPGNSRIKQITVPLQNDDRISILGTQFTISEVPGHTLDHLAFFSPGDDTHDTPWLFSGDTLFSGGCGRLFEGSAEQMLHSLNTFRTHPANTEIYCAHEYTLANLAFAKAVLPDNRTIAQYTDYCRQKRQSGLATLPSTIKNERDINLFLNCTRQDVAQAVSSHDQTTGKSELEVFTALRRWKDNF